MTPFWGDRRARSRRGSSVRVGREIERLEARELLSVDVSAVGQGSGRPEFDGNGVLVAERVTYQVSIYNPGDAEPVVLTEALDGRFEFTGSHVSEYDGSYYDGPYTESFDENTGVYSVTFPSLKGAIVRIEGLVHPSSTGIPGPPLIDDYSITTADVNVNPQTGGSISVDAPSPIVDVALTSTGPESPIQDGAEVVYTFVATNRSSVETAPNAELFVRLTGDSQEDATGLPTYRNPGWVADMVWPGGFIWGPGLPGSPPYMNGLFYGLGDLGPGESRTATLVLKPKLPAGPSPTLAFPAILTSDAYDSDAANNVVDVATPFVPETEVRIDPPAAIPSAILAGENLTFSYHVANLGRNPATGLVVYQALPAGAEFVSAALNGAPVAGSVVGGTLKLALPDQGAAGAQGDLVVTLATGGMNVSTGETLSAPFLATWNENPNGVRGETVMGVVAPRGTLGIAMTANAPNTTVNGPDATINRPLGVVFTATNPNATDARDVVVALTLPPESQLGIIPGPYDVAQTPTAQIVAFHLDVLPAGASHAFQVFTVPLAAVGSSIRATGTIVEAGRPAGDYPPLSLTVDAQGWSYIDVRRLDAPGGTLRFSVTNYGTTTAEGINVDVDGLWLGSATRDGVPLDGVLSINAPPDHFPRDWNFGPPYRLWTGNLAPGESTVFEVSNELAGPEQSPYGWVEGAGSPIYPNRTSTGPTADPPATLPLDVVAQMTTDPASVEVGGSATFIATVTNIGPFDGEGLIVHATIPSTARLVSAPPGASLANGVLSIPIDRLPVGITETFRFVVSPNPDALAEGSLTSALNVQASQPLLHPFLAVTGAAVGVTAVPGVSTITWTGSPHAITEITATFTVPLAAGAAAQASDLVLTTPGRDLRFGTRDDGRVKIASARYDPAALALTLIPAHRLPANQFHRVTISGLASADGRPLTPFTATLARGRRLRYVAEAGERVALRLSGGGWLDDLLDGSNSGVRLSVVNPSRRRSSLGGVVLGGGSPRPRVELGRIVGAESTRIHLPSPPFVFASTSIEPPAAPRRPWSWSAWARRPRSMR